MLEAWFSCKILGQDRPPALDPRVHHTPAASQQGGYPRMIPHGSAKRLLLIEEREGRSVFNHFRLCGTRCHSSAHKNNELQEYLEEALAAQRRKRDNRFGLLFLATGHIGNAEI